MIIVAIISEIYLSHYLIFVVALCRLAGNRSSLVKALRDSVFSYEAYCS